MEIIQGLIPAFSCRAIAVLKYINGKPTVVVRKVITYDWVLYPSHKEAHATSPATGVLKAIETITESVTDRVKAFSEDIILPLKEILENVGEKDPSVNLIMESFDLSNDDIVGFDAKRQRAIITDGNNKMFVKMSPETMSEVQDFYNSFNL